MKPILMVLVSWLAGVSFGSQPPEVIEPPRLAAACTNKLVTFTNLQGQVYRGVSLIRADLDGVIYRVPDGASGGRVCYTNLAPELLESWGIPTNWMEYAELRAGLKTHMDRRDRLADQLHARFQATDQQARREVDKVKVRIRGKVIQRVGSAALVSLGDATLYLTECPSSWVDGDRVATTVYPTGSENYTTVLGANKTVRSYTCSLEHAVAITPGMQELRFGLMVHAISKDIPYTPSDFATAASMEAWIWRWSSRWGTEPEAPTNATVGNSTNQVNEEAERAFRRRYGLDR